MSTFRVSRDSDNPYVMMNKQFIYDKRLSYKAKGVLAYILSRPDNWQIYEVEVIKHSKDGRDSVRSGIKELLEQGYMIRHEKRNEKGQFEGYEYEVFEIPKENPKSENPTSVNQTLLNNDSTKYLNNVVVNAFAFYQNNFGVISPYMSDQIGMWVDDIGEELVIEAMKIALKNNKNWKYCEGILKDWFKNNLRTIDAVQAHSMQFKKKKEPVSPPQQENNTPALAGFWGYDDE